MRLIDADALTEKYGDWYTEEGTEEGYIGTIKGIVESMPTIEERKKGKWIRHDEIKNIYGGIYIECSECGEKYVVQYIENEKFCRNCGADMREGNQ